MSKESLKHALQPVLGVLNDLGGKFVFSDEEGNKFVLMSKKEFKKEHSHQEQLPLPPQKAVEAAVRQHAPDLSEEVVDAINRDIALSGVEAIIIEDDLALPFEPAPKLRFEPLKGDLPPQLQD